MSGAIQGMLEQTGTVIESDTDTALVEIVRRSACGSCGVGSSCGTSTVSKLFKSRSNVLRLKHDLQLHAGDEIVVGIPESYLLRAAAWAYMVPMLFMLAFAMVVSLDGFDDMMVFLASMVGLYCGFRFSVAVRSHRPSDEIVLLRKVGAHIVNFEKHKEVNIDE